MTATTTSAVPPTRKQLAYLRRLAHVTGTTFSYPHTRAQASRQIRALLDRPFSQQLELDLDRAAVNGGDLPDRSAA